MAPDLPSDNPAAQLTDYADAVVASVGDRRELIVVGQSFGGFTAPLVADRLRADILVFVAGMSRRRASRPVTGGPTSATAPRSAPRSYATADSPATMIRMSPTTTMCRA